MNLYPVPDMKLNDKSIYDSDLCAVINEVSPTINMDTPEISLNDKLNLGRFVLYIGYLSIGDQHWLFVDILASK